MAITVMPMESRHVEQVAGIHAAELPEDFLPSLGWKFLVRCYYPAMLSNPYACVLVAVDDRTNRVSGFVNIATDPARYLAWFVKRSVVALSMCMLRLLVVDPKRVMEAFAIARSGVPAPEGAGEIAFIAVERDHQKEGIGEVMVRAANRHLLQHRITRCFTKTLATNEHVINFYRKHWAAALLANAAILGNNYVFLVWDVASSK